MKNYPVYRYNDRFVLRVSPLLLATIAYSLRHLIIILLAYAPSQKFGGSMDFLKHQTNPLLLVSDMPALALALAWSRRHEDSSALMRSIWHKGRALLMTAVGLHLGLMLWLSGSAILHHPAGSGQAVLLQGLLDVAILAYLFRSSLVKDIFEDYPVGVQKTKK